MTTEKYISRNLPPPGTKRWVAARKAQVVRAVQNGFISIDDACQTYNLSLEEFLSWERLFSNHGYQGLRATRIREYRDHEMA
ncbi:MAG TPA: DUF1153 domain-containing protein [Rhodospirillaceae bacterium]|nr:MAG: hypothetical protein A2018_06180 [Alphaproteobacteria bacterium GWF2_58_20]HAU29100.1 DUF1153 domain-containing protein [Rhodospirillaceae bacterium]